MSVPARRCRVFMSVPARRRRVEFSGAMLGKKEDRKRILEITGY